MNTVEDYSSAEAEIRLRAKYRTSTQEDADWLLVKVDALRAEIGRLNAQIPRPAPMPYVPTPNTPVPMPVWPSPQIFCSTVTDTSALAEDISKTLHWNIANQPR